jgi:hypothetical protein
MSFDKVGCSINKLCRGRTARCIQLMPEATIVGFTQPEGKHGAAAAKMASPCVWARGMKLV